MKSMNYKNVRHDNQIVKVTNLSTGKVELYKNAMRASKAIGCSHVLVYRCLNPYDYATTAYGHKVEYVPLTYGILDGEMNNVENA